MTDAHRGDPALAEVHDVLDDVDLLEELLSSGRHIPLTPSVVVSEEGVLELLERIRADLPEAITTARHLIDDREHILGDAHREADDLVSGAHQEAERVVTSARAEADRIREVTERHAASLVADHTIVREATTRADQELAAAREQAASVRAEADEYAREVMERLAEQLTRTLTTVQKGLHALEPAPAPARRRDRG